MRGAIISTLQALYKVEEVTAKNSIKLGTTRITNEINALRNGLDIDIITDRVDIKNRKWYGSYRLIRTKENLQKVEAILGLHFQDEVQES